MLSMSRPQKKLPSVEESTVRPNDHMCFRYIMTALYQPILRLTETRYLAQKNKGTSQQSQAAATTAVPRI